VYSIVEVCLKTFCCGLSIHSSSANNRDRIQAKPLLKSILLAHSGKLLTCQMNM